MNKLITNRIIRKYVLSRSEEILYCILYFLIPFVFYLKAHFNYLFRSTTREELEAYLAAEKRYQIVTLIWLLTIIVILLLVLISKI